MIINCAHNLQKKLLSMTIPRVCMIIHKQLPADIQYKTLCTIEGHTLVEMKIKHFVRDDNACLALLILKDDELVPLMKVTVRILAALLPLPYSIWKRCKNKHKCKRCP